MSSTIIFTTQTTTLFQNTTTDSTAFINIDPRCGQYYNSTSNMLVKDYEGIPENLILNVAVWFGLIVLYTFLRHIGDYGKFGLLKNDEQRWNKTFFSKLPLDKLNLFSSNSNSSSDNEQSLERSRQSNNVNEELKNNYDNNERISNENLDSIEKVADETVDKSSTNQFLSDVNKADKLSINNNDNYDKMEQIRKNSYSHLDRLVDNPHAHYYKESHFLSWFVNLVKLKDKHIEEKCGKDAHYYIVFQRYLIVYLLVVSIIAMSVIFPINIQGSVLYKNNVFGSTTILNVMPDSPVLWVHLALSWVFLVIGLIFMRLFSAEMSYTESDYISRSVLITHYPDNNLSTEENVNFVYRHFQEAYPELKITDVQFCYDIGKIVALEKERRAMYIGKLTSEKMYEKSNVRPVMHPFHMGAFVEILCCYSKRCFKLDGKQLIDAIEFYTKREKELRDKIDQKREKTLKDPLGVLFITFENQKMAKNFLKDYRFGLFGTAMKKLFPYKKFSNCYLCHELPKNSEISQKVKSDMWNVRFAKAPSNIKWENITKIGPVWWLRIILINIILFVLMIFFTTPSILIEKLTTSNGIFNFTTIEQYFPSYVAELLPSLILRLLAVLLPVLVSYTSLLELHWSRSAENRSIMIKVYMLLLFMVLILPTLGLTSLNALFEFKWLNQTSEYSVKWRCISDNGAFFLKYVTTCSLIGTALDLLRLPDLFLYLIRSIWSRSRAERLSNRMEAAFEFDYGVQYAWMLTVFTIVLSFSVVCPLIAPFGLFYLILKHIIDRYNIYFAYVATKVDKEIHKSAVTFCIFSLLMLQLFILFFIAIRNEANKMSTMSIVQIVIVCLTFSIYFGRLFFGVFKKLTPFNKKKKKLLKQGMTGGDDKIDGNNQSPNRSYDGDDDDDYDDENEDNDEIERNYATMEVQIVPVDEDDDKKPEYSIIKGVEQIVNIQPSSSAVELNDELENGKKKYSVNSKKKEPKKFRVLLESPFMPSILRPRSPMPVKLDNITSKKNSIENFNPKQNLDLNDIKLIVDGLDDYETNMNPSYGTLKITNKPLEDSSAVNNGFQSNE